MAKHNKQGNCWENKLVYSCDECGEDNLCDVCHKHDQPRGSCEECDHCVACDQEEG